jgi:hypothetical protein
MLTDAEITFADHAGRLYGRRYGITRERERLTRSLKWAAGQDTRTPGRSR